MFDDDDKELHRGSFIAFLLYRLKELGNKNLTSLEMMIDKASGYDEKAKIKEAINQAADDYGRYYLPDGLVDRLIKKIEAVE